jgi:hypothetical protein
MKSTLRLFFLLAAFSGLLLTGCEPVEEENTSDDPRDPYIGVWQFVELKSSDGQSYIVTITKDPKNSAQVILENFGNPGSSEIEVTGIVTSNQIVVSSQSLSNGWVVEGSGKISNPTKTSMTWNYAITAGGDKLYYTATANKQ